MGHCRLCHGAIYTGNPPAPSCVACHKLANASNDAPHAANWVSGNINGLKHSTTDSGNAPACYQCHAGGKFSHPAPVPAPAGTAPGCFNGTLCHNAAGHTFTVAGHYLPAAANLASCQTCHATPASGSNPRFTIPKNATLTPNGCENCHNRPGLAHPYIWLPGRGGSPTFSHASAQNVVASCGLCHGGAALTGGGTAYPGGISPPACFSTPVAAYGGTACHFTKPINAGGTTVGCGSCHGNPSHSATGEPSSTSSNAGPNRAFRHTNHFNNIGASLTCNVCHTGYGTGKTAHSTKQVFGAVTAPVAVMQGPAGPLYNNRSTVVVYTPGAALTLSKCTNVSCHGGKTLSFPNWKSTTVFNVNTCSNCHTTSTTLQIDYAGIYIGPFSGNNDTPDTSGGDVTTRPFTPANGLNLHQMHNSFGQCTDCHNIAGLHFNNILLGRRKLLPGFAAPTVTGPSIISYSFISSTQSACVATCHSARSQSWYK
jgi:predicted CxxxxCH...CXXCH cytochrome family protein